MPKYILAIDQGTTCSTVMLVDEKMRIVAKAGSEFPQIYPRPGLVEHDPEAIWESVLSSLRRVLAQANIEGKDISGIGITNQRETAIIWDRATGRPIHNAIVWQDRRTAPLCDELRASGHQVLFQQRTGLVLDPYFSGTKVRWLLDNVYGARAGADRGDLAFGTIETYLIWRLTGGQAHITDVSNASRTLLFNLHTLNWDEELCSLLKVPLKILPRIASCAEIYGHTLGVPGLPDKIAVCGAAGDQQAALFGQACFTPGSAKCTYGTGAFLLLNTGHRPIASKNGLLTTVAWKIGDETVYALEGSAFIAGAAVQWLRDGLKIISSAAEVETLANQVPDSGEVIFVPALVGLGAPHWRPNARGIITGITRGTSAAHLARAALEGIALQIFDLVNAMCEDLGEPLASFKVDGGATVNNLLMQIQADLLSVPLVRPEVVETTALGAAFLAGLATKVWPHTQAIAESWKEQRRFSPQCDAMWRTQLLARWSEAVAKA